MNILALLSTNFNGFLDLSHISINIYKQVRIHEISRESSNLCSPPPLCTAFPLLAHFRSYLGYQKKAWWTDPRTHGPTDPRTHGPTDLFAGWNAGKDECTLQFTRTEGGKGHRSVVMVLLLRCRLIILARQPLVDTTVSYAVNPYMDPRLALYCALLTTQSPSVFTPA